MMTAGLKLEGGAAESGDVSLWHNKHKAPSYPLTPFESVKAESSTSIAATLYFDHCRSAQYHTAYESQ